MTGQEIIDIIQKMCLENELLVLEEASFDGTPNYANINKIEYEEYNRVFVIKKL